MRYLSALRELRNSESRNHSLRTQIYRAIALNLEALDDGQTLARHLARWREDCPGDPKWESEYSRLRQRYPQYLRAH